MLQHYNRLKLEDMNNQADLFFEKLDSWKPELEKLREIVLRFPVLEELKWGAPMYTFNGRNIIGILGFKNHFAIWFNNGVFLKDERRLLVSAGEKTKSLRQFRMQTMAELVANEKVLTEYIWEAIEVEKAGLKIPVAKNQPVVIPDELQSRLDADELLTYSFKQFTPGRQKEFAEYIAEPKQAATREKRLEKIIPMILKGIGLNDRYKKA